MSRIRSIHPTQWTDDDFVALSMAARILAIGIRNECDDKGVFEWKPQSIKMRIFPADSIEVVPLLEEMIEARQCVKFEHDGKFYGAIRNFRKWQRPKKPNDIYPLPESLFDYVSIPKSGGDKGGEVETSSPPVPHQFPTSTEIAIQMEDVGCRMEETKVDVKVRTKASPDIDFPDWLPMGDWEDFISMRKKIKKSPTDSAIKHLIAKLGELRDKGHPPDKVLQESIMNSWQGLFELKGNKDGKAKNTGFESTDYSRGSDGFDVG